MVKEFLLGSLRKVPVRTTRTGMANRAPLPPHASRLPSPKMLPTLSNQVSFITDPKISMGICSGSIVAGGSWIFTLLGLFSFLLLSGFSYHMVYLSVSVCMVLALDLKVIEVGHA